MTKRVGEYCEDYPCCGHTAQDPCWPMPYDQPEYWDPSINPHCFCEHENGICNADETRDYDEEELESYVD